MIPSKQPSYTNQPSRLLSFCIPLSFSFFFPLTLHSIARPLTLVPPGPAHSIEDCSSYSKLISGLAAMSQLTLHPLDWVPILEWSWTGESTA